METDAKRQVSEEEIDISINQSTLPQVGLGLLLKDGNVFRCYDHIHLTMFHSELGASKAVLDAGYNIDTLMMRCVSGLHQCTKP